MIFLRFQDEQEFISATAEYRDDEGNLTIPNIDIIGTIYEGGTYDADGNTLTSPTAIDGYHVNAVEVPVELEQFQIVRPNKPYRIFAGE